MAGGTSWRVSGHPFTIMLVSWRKVVLSVVAHTDVESISAEPHHADSDVMVNLLVVGAWEP